MNYQINRQNIYNKIREQKIFNTDTLDLDREYALGSIYYVNNSDIIEIRKATETLNKIILKTVKIIQQGNDELFKELFLPLSIKKALSLNFSKNSSTLIGRFDFAKTKNGFKMIEFNADTPCGIIESYHVNDIVCNYYGVKNPNYGLENDFKPAFTALLKNYKAQGYDIKKVVFSSLDCWAEDIDTTKYLMNLSGIKEANYIKLGNLIYKNNALYDKKDLNKKIDVLYRLHGLNEFAMDKDIDGFNTGINVINLMNSKKLALINPPSALIAQSKCLIALIWSLAEQNLFFNSLEIESIKKYLIPTYFDKKYLKNKPFVSKPVFGREGGGITIFNEKGLIIEKDYRKYFWDQQMIYQEFVDLEKSEVETLKGLKKGYLLWGNFIINGKASAVYLRQGNLITNTLAKFLPIGYL